MIRAALLALIAVAVLASPAIADVPQPGPDPYSTEHWYDREGTRYFCLDIDADLGCLYRVENRENDFVLYWVGHDGIRRSYVVPKTGWGTDGDLQFAAEGHEGGWRIYIYRNWVYLGWVWIDDPNAVVADPYPCCPDGSC